MGQPAGFHTGCTSECPGTFQPAPGLRPQCQTCQPNVSGMRPGYGSLLKPPQVILECEEPGLKAAALAQTVTGATRTSPRGHCHPRWAVVELCAGGRGSAPNVWWPFGLFREESDPLVQVLGMSGEKPLIDCSLCNGSRCSSLGWGQLPLRCWPKSRVKSEMGRVARLFAKAPTCLMPKRKFYKGQSKVEDPCAL